MTESESESDFERTFGGDGRTGTINTWQSLSDSVDSAFDPLGAARLGFLS